jgi:hypothetical protein
MAQHAGIDSAVFADVSSHCAARTLPRRRDQANELFTAYMEQISA